MIRLAAKGYQLFSAAVRQRVCAASVSRSPAACPHRALCAGNPRRAHARLCRLNLGAMQTRP
eukprot:14056958-Alexandrium_andersonii.AAC.1